MSSTRKASPARSQGEPAVLQRSKTRASRSVGSPAKSASGRLSNIVDKFREDNRDSFSVSPLNKTVTNDNTDIEMPRRQSWWRKVENSREMIEVPENVVPVNPAEVFKDFDMVVFSQEKNLSVDLPESSGSESVHSIVVPQRKLFIQKENQPQKDFGAIADASKPNMEDQTMHVVAKNLFSQTTKRTKPVFPSALLNMTNDNTLGNKTKELPVEIKAQPKGLFGNRPGHKRKNMFADLVVSESEDEVLDIQPRRFTFNKPSEPTRRRSSNASSITTDMELDEWKMLPSSTMVEHQIEAQVTTPGKRARLSKLYEAKESTNAAVEQTLGVFYEKGRSVQLVDKQTHEKSKQHELVPQQTTPSERTSLNKFSEDKETIFGETEQRFDIIEERDKSKHPVNKEDQYRGEENQVEAHLATPEKEASLSNLSSAKESSNAVIEQTLNDVQEREQSVHDLNKDNHDKSKQHQLELQMISPCKETSLGKLLETKKITTAEIQQKSDNIKEKEHAINKESHENNKELKLYTELASPGKRAVLSKISETTNTEDKQEPNVEKTIHSEQAVNKEDGNRMEVETDENIQEQAIEEEDDNQNDGEKEKLVTDYSMQNQSRKVNNEDQNTSTEQLRKLSMTKEANKERNTQTEPATDDEEKEENEHQLIYEEDHDDNSKNENNEHIVVESSKKIDEQDNAQCNVGNIDAEMKIQCSSDEKKNQEADRLRGENVENGEVQNKSKHLDITQDKRKEDYVQQKSLVNIAVSEVSQKVAEKDVDQEKNYKMIEGDDKELTDKEGEENKNNVEEDEKQEMAEDEDVEQEESEEIEEDGEQEESQEIVEEDDKQDESDEGMVEAEDEESQEMVAEEQEENQEIVEEEDDEHEESQEMVAEEQEENQEIVEEEDGEREESQEIVEEEDDEQEQSQEIVENDDKREESQEIEEEADEQNEIEDEDNEQEESQEMAVEDDDQEDNQEVAEEEDEEEESQEIVDVDEQNDNSQEMEEDVIEGNEEVQEEPHQSDPTDANVTHDTTGRNRKKRETNTPEAILHDATNELDSFTAKGRNTSVRKTIPKYFPLRQSMASATDSIGLSDGTKNSSAEGSGWDSHRTTRKTLRQTFGKDFTPRKSLRALVMEKSAKRQTMINEANAALKLHQANSTELPDDRDEMDYEDDAVESDHEISIRMRQAKLEMYTQNFKKQTVEMKQRIAEEIRNPIRLNILNRPKKLSICRANKTTQSAQKSANTKRLKAIENLPPELVEDMKYKPPKKFKPGNASWITNRLYKFLESKLEPKYDYKSRIRAEKLVETIYNFTSAIKRLKVAPLDAVAELKREMARLDVVQTHHEFYDFMREFLPYEVRTKVIPDIINKIPVPRDVFGSII